MQDFKSQIEFGVNAYKGKRLQDAHQNFVRAKEINADNPLPDMYIRIIADEENISSEITRLRRARNMTTSELETVIQYFKDVSPDSIYFSDIQTNLLPLFIGDYVKRLRTEIREHITSKNITEARKLIAKLSAHEGTASDVRTFNKLIDDLAKNL